MLKTRLVTALVLVAMVLVILFWLPPGAGIGFTAALVLLGAWEWSRFAGLTEPNSRLLYTFATAVLCALAWDETNQARDWLALMAIATVWWAIAFLWLALKPSAVNRAAAAIAGLVVLVPAWVGMGRLLKIDDGPVRGELLFLFLLVLVWAADIGAFFAGKRFGRVKLAPRVSPNKTWEGVFGGLFAAGLAAAGGVVLFDFPVAAFVFLCLAVVLASVVGDLTESMFKRFAGVKDSGRMLPGHGGVLDRIDSVTAAVPFYVLGLGWLGVIG
ncbi:MAG: phosphatidate cytidylyltransferase [Steroidobacteraceae bacterium]|nr:phosphatidate cytidylyltransferase [Steroidobacteraceae bacterium]